MQIDPLIAIENLTAEHPQTRRLFCRLGLDVLTEGSLTLREAALRHGLEVQDLIQELEPVVRGKGPIAQDWLKASKAELVAHIINYHHAFTVEELARFGLLLDTALVTTWPPTRSWPR